MTASKGEHSSIRDVIAAVDHIKPLYDSVAVFRDRATAPIWIDVRRGNERARP